MPLRLLLHMKPFHLRFVLLLLSYSILVVLDQHHNHRHVHCHQRPGPGAAAPSSAGARPRDPLAEFVAQQGGPIRARNLTLTKGAGPIPIRRDIVIKRDARLTIEAGVELHFERQRGIIVQGVLEVLGQPHDRVKLQLLKSPTMAMGRPQQQQQAARQHASVRLVDGDLPSEGRVQIKLNDRWHSLCTNSKNLTAADIRVLCRQAGHQEGHWYRWFPKRNLTAGAAATIVVPEVLSSSFQCAGGEASLQQCRRWNRARVGGGVCDGQSDIGVRCSRRLAGWPPDTDEQQAAASNYWRGIEFQESETQQEYILEGQMKQRVSQSRLSHLFISEAGLDEAGNATAAVRVYGQPPRMSHVQIANSVYGILVQECQEAVRLSNIRLVNNLAAPLFINTSYGKVELDRLHIENNGGDAVRVARHERTAVGSHDFCKFANLGSDQTYPVVLSHEQQFLRSGRDCCQEFISQNQQLTVHFPVLRSTPNNLLPETADSQRLVSVPAGVQLGRDAQLIVFDDYREEFPFRLPIRNGTRAQSIVSKAGRLKICYEPASYRTVLFTIEVVADVISASSPTDYDYGTGIAHDVEITNSHLARNQGRGVWLDNLRAGARILNTTVIQHNYLAGVHVENGTGEVIIQASQVSNNTGHGIYIHQAGGYYHIDNSTVSGNSGAGVLVEYDPRPELVPFNHTMHLGYSLVAHNGDSGLAIGNVCRSDAFWNISMNSFIGNGEDALHFQSCHASHDNVQRFHQLTSRLNTTAEPAAGQSRLQELYVTHNVFLANQRRAIRLAPIYFVKSFIRHNLFREHPLAVVYINNQQSQAALGGEPAHLRNSTHLAPVSVRIASNRFYANRGRYVANVGLHEEGARQALVFTKNHLEDNAVSEPYSELRPRSRVSAVVVVSSSNVKVVRNRFDNPRSSYELGVHLEAHAKIINATANFWGFQLDAGAIYRRIFDRKNRYNLAQVEFLQYLLSPEDLEYITDLSFDRERDKITVFRNGSRLGGEVKGYEELPAGTYTVQDDITVLPGSHLVIRDGVTLRFGEGVGLMNQGRLDAFGKANSQIHFTSLSPTSRWPSRPGGPGATTTASPLASAWVSHRSEPALDQHNQMDFFIPANATSRQAGAVRSRRPPRQAGLGEASASLGAAASVRLSHTTMGRLEVQIDGVWGSVCDYNFDIHDAAVACQQLGMIVNRDDWLLERFQYAANDQQQLYDSLSSEALLTNLRCDPALDTDLTACRAEVSLRGDFDGTCSSEVGIRCFPPSWSGVRFGMGAETSTLEHVTIQRAGMFDYAKYSLKPALQVDFNRHWLNSLVVRANSDSGLGIVFNDVIGRHFSELAVNEGKFLNNERHGVELRSRGLTIRGCQLANNRQNGLDYNPTLSQEELDDLLSWLHTPKNADSVVTLSFAADQQPARQQQQPLQFAVPSSEDSYRFFVIPRGPRPDVRESFTIGTDPGHMLSIQLVSPIQRDSSETLNMSLGLNADGSSLVYDLRVNLTSLPMVSPGYKFHFNYSSGAQPAGNIVLYVRSRYNNRDLKVLTKFIPAHLIMPKFDQTATNINARLINSLVIANNTISRNGIGLKFRYPNYAHGPGGAAHNWRYANETTNITDNTFEANYFSAVFVSSDELEQEPDAAGPQLDTATGEVRFHLLANRMRRNKDGVRQFSRDIRRSHNVFHWTINETTYELNKGGGVNLMLPYYWRYDANLSHTLELHHNHFRNNVNFELGVDGHFGSLNVSHNQFRENRCRSRLISVAGMEKRLLFRHNQIELNTCNRIVDVNIHSHADKLGSIETHFEFNALRHNRRLISNATLAGLAANFHHPRLLDRLHPHATDYALGLRGIQALNVTRNLFDNRELRFDLVVAISMDPEERTVNAVENYWGSSRPRDISERIFDFDDWNSFAVAEFSPFLVSDSFQAASMLASERELAPGPAWDPAPGPERAGAPWLGADWTRQRAPQVSGALGGRLTRSLVLHQRREPYVVEADLTVMPGVRLTIERGATLLFMPNVGVLVLGELVAVGTRDRPIQMRPLLSSADVLPLSSYLFPARTRPNISLAGAGDSLAHEHNYAFRHYQFTYPVDMGSVRLCKNEICNDGAHVYENNVEEPQLRREALASEGAANNSSAWRMDGFLEVFNMTTLQWVPVCDPLFTEHAARVVCRQLGYSHLSLFKRGRRYTIEQEQVGSVKSWPRSLQCEGDEANLSSCPLAAAPLANYTTACARDTNQFVYVYCRDFAETPAGEGPGRVHQARASNEHLNHWGGIRFSCPAGRPSPANFEAGALEQPAAGNRSRLQYVTIERAGWLHRRRAPALQLLQCSVQMEHVSISHSAYHGLELVASQASQHFHALRVTHSLGLGMNYLSLTGSSSAARLVPYLPLKQADLTAGIFGLVDVCGANKELRIDERVLLVFRYASRPLDCVKIISSKLGVKHLGIRMLQFNLFNSSQLTARPDHVRIYDGNVFDWDSRLLAELGVEERHRAERPELKFYQSSDSSMTVRVHASGAGLAYGFIAEVVTTPVSYTVQRDLYTNLTQSEFAHNRLGAVSVSSAGESTPNLILRGNRFEANCLHLWGNFTSCVAPVHMELQNCQRLWLAGNLFRANQAGGLMAKSYSHSAVAALDAHIERNVFEANQNTYALALVGPRTDPYQRASVQWNLLTRNRARYLPNVLLSRVVANFSANMLTSNVGKHQIEVAGFDRLPLSYQAFHGNWIYNNTATFERDQSTISCNSAGQQYSQNYLVNPDNHFELSARNWSRYDARPFQVARDDEIIHLVAGDGSSRDVLRKNVDSIPLSVLDAKRLDLHQAAIGAQHNWWGFNTTAAIRGRIRDRLQHDELIRVEFAPFLETNRSLLSGVCAGGWRRVNGACLLYIGTRMTYAEARDFCDRERATLPLLRGNHYEFTDFVADSQDWATSGLAGLGGSGPFDARDARVWVRSFDVSREACPALNDYRTRNFDCQDRYAFLCEKDPQVVVTLLHWHRETGGLIAVLLALVTIVLTCCCSACWVYKSRERHREKLERKSTLYASMRSVRAAGSNPAWLNTASSNNSLSEFFLHRQLYNTDKSSITDLSLSTQWTQPSNDETNLVRLDPNGAGAAKQARPVPLQPPPAATQKQVYAAGQAQARPRSRGAGQYFEPPQAPYNPSYVSPAPSGQLETFDFAATTRRKTPTPAPSYRELPRHSSSRTHSLASSFDGDDVGEPGVPDQFGAAESFARDHLQHNRPAPTKPERGALANSRSFLTSTPEYDFRPPPVEPPPELSYQYSNIRFEPDPSLEPARARPHRRSASNSSQASQESLARAQQPQPPPPLHPTKGGQLYAARPVRVSADLLDAGSSSSAPTLYSNQTFEESTNSYLETYNLYNDAYGQNLLQQQMNNDQISIVLTERSSVTDSIVNTRITESQIEYTTLRPPAAQSLAEAAYKLAGQQPRRPPPADQTIYQNGHFGRAAPPHQRAASDVGASAGNLSRLSQGNLMETSFDLDSPTGGAAFGGSQPLAVGPFGGDGAQRPPPDSKSGSRVYLETSFE